MTERSQLRFRKPDYLGPGRAGEPVVEVIRNGEVVASIYGSREGIHIVSVLQPLNRAFKIDGGPFPFPGWVITLLANGEECPWCAGTKQVHLNGAPEPCPVCREGWK